MERSMALTGRTVSIPLMMPPPPHPTLQLPPIVVYGRLASGEAWLAQQHGNPDSCAVAILRAVTDVVFQMNQKLV